MHLISWGPAVSRTPYYALYQKQWRESKKFSCFLVCTFFLPLPWLLRGYIRTLISNGLLLFCLVRIQLKLSISFTPIGYCLLFVFNVDSNGHHWNFVYAVTVDMVLHTKQRRRIQCTKTMMMLNCCHGHGQNVTGHMSK